MGTRIHRGKPITSGYFVDWDGKIREAANPGAGMRCVLVEGDHIEVLERNGETSYECVWYESVDAILTVCREVDPVVVSGKGIAAAPR